MSRLAHLLVACALVLPACGGGEESRATKEPDAVPLPGDTAPTELDQLRALGYVK